MASVIIAGVKPPELLYVVGAFFVITLVTFLSHTYVSSKQLISNLGIRVASIRMLRVLSFIFGFGAFAMVLMQRSIYGGPVLYLSFAVVLLSISLFYDRSNKMEVNAMTSKSKIGDSGEVLGNWIGDLRKELKDIRKEGKDGLNKIDALKLRLEAVEVEARLVEAFASVLSKSMESMSKVLAESSKV